MEIGNRIKQLRIQRGTTQEAVAQYLGVTPQAVSKWERNVATPDISMLPDISAYFGVSIDELFALSDETRMERIQNMIWDVRFLDLSVVSKEKEFLLEKGRREPNNSKPYELLADMELHIANEHKEYAVIYAKEALKRDPGNKNAHASLVEGMGGRMSDWYVSNHFQLIAFYREYIQHNPNDCCAYMWLIDHLLDAGRVEEAAKYCEVYQKIDNTFRSRLYQGNIYWHMGKKDQAHCCWKQMQKDFPDEWMVYMSLADILARAGQYEEAKKLYRKSLQLQEKPKFTDPFESIAQICELQGNIQEAIDTLTEELEIMSTEWGETSGETSDLVRRNIARLEKLL